MEDFVFCHDNICLILHKALNYSYDALQTPPPSSRFPHGRLICHQLSLCKFSLYTLLATADPPPLPLETMWSPQILCPLPLGDKKWLVPKTNQNSPSGLEHSSTYVFRT